MSEKLKVFDSESAIEYVKKVVNETVSEVEPDENSVSLKQKIQQLQAENQRYANALQSLTEDGHADCEYCDIKDQIAEEALNGSEGG